MMECLTTLEFWTQAAIHVGIVLFVLGSIAIVQLSSNKTYSSDYARLAQRKSSSLTKNRPLVRSQ